MSDLIYENLEKLNLVDQLDEDTHNAIVDECITGFNHDLAARQEWEYNYEKWIKLATQVAEQKTWPWRNAANVKYPLVATASMQFQARAYPALVPPNRVVRIRTYGEDPDNQKKMRADRISQHMSYQVLKQMKNWDADMDRLLFILPIVGCAFKKTYFDSRKKVNVSKLVLPRDLVVNYWATSLEDAYRKTEILYLTRNEIVERQRFGTYRDDYDPDLSDYKVQSELHKKALANYANIDPTGDKISATLPILEMHTWWDLDKDGYKEPYIITIDPDQKKILRMAVGYDEEGVEINGDQIVAIEQKQYYTKFSFLPSPDGGFYDFGFGAMLGPINETTNTLINQLIDSGTIYNLQGGFLAKGLRLKGGNYNFEPGEWKFVNSVGDDLRKAILPLPVREPSTVLFQLLGTIVESGQRLASVAEIFVGKMPGQNTPATTTMATIEQGMKVFTAIYKRIYRSLDEEFKKLYDLNKQYLDPVEYFQVLDSQEMGTIQQTDYQMDDTDVCPAADPDSTSDTEKLMKVQALMEILQLGTIDPKWATMKFAEAMRIEDIQEGMNYQPPPPPEMQKMQAETQMKQQESQQKMQLEQMKAELNAQQKQMELMFKQKEMEMDFKMKQLEMMFKAQEESQKAQVTMLQHKVGMQTTQEKHAMQMQQMDEKSKMQAKAKRRTRIKEDKDGSLLVEDED